VKRILCFIGIEITVAQGLMNRLEKEGFIRPALKGKRYGNRTKQVIYPENCDILVLY